MKDTILICDLDGTLADCEHRRKHVQKTPKDWSAFFAGMKDDICNDRIRWLVDKWEGSVWFVTGRGAEYHADTVEWIMGAAKIERGTWMIAMRAEKDFRSDAIVKREIYDQMIRPLGQPCLVLDDRSSVVAMWRELGLECWQVALGDF
jgi:hypothetical protein